jgi:hypothetical protein
LLGEPRQLLGYANLAAAPLSEYCFLGAGKQHRCLGGREYYSFEIINTSKKEFMQYYLTQFLLELPTDNPVGEL